MARTRAPDYDTKRLAILRRSAELFAQFGYSGTSITMIADACGVSKALLYHYYPEKEALLFDILHAHLRDLIAASERAAASARESDGRLFALAASLLEAYRGADAEHQVQITNLKLLPRARQEILRTMERRLVQIFSEALAEAVPEVGNGALLKPLVMSLFGMLNWHYLWFRDGGGLSRDEYARLVVRLIMGGAASAVAAVAAPPAEILPAALGSQPRIDCAGTQHPEPIAGDASQGKPACAGPRRARAAQ